MNTFQMPSNRRAGVVMAAGICVAVLFGTVERAVATWSIIMVDTRTREVAVGSATCLSNFDLKAGLPVVLVDVGGAAAQSAIDSSGRNRMLIRRELLNGTLPDVIINLLDLQDFQHQSRQYGIVDVPGRATTFTGSGASDFADGIIGQTGTIVYAIQGNILTGAPVIEMAEQAVLTTNGDIPAKLMAGMLAARAMGGDGRCSCQRESPGSSPTDCGSPPDSFAKAADVGFMIVARTGDRDGGCDAQDGCASGDYFMSFNVRFQTENNADPVFQLRSKFNARRASLIGRADAVQSTSSVDPTSFPDDGTGTATLTFTLRDWEGTIVDDESFLVTVEHAADSAGATTIDPVINDGNGTYHVDLTGSNRGGRDHFLVAVCDPARPVFLIPRPSLLSICTSQAACDDNQFCNGTEACDLGTGECEAGVAPCTGDEICNEVDDTCEPITCHIASAPVPELLVSALGMPVVNAKNRAISIKTAKPGRDQALRVRFVDLPPPFDIWEFDHPQRVGPGDYFVGEPVQRCENGGEVLVPCIAGFCSNPPPGRLCSTDVDCCSAAGPLPRNWFWAAPLVCDDRDAHVMDWHGVCDVRSCGVGSCVGGLNPGTSCTEDDDCADVVHLFHEGFVPDGVYDVQVVDSSCSFQEEGSYSTPLRMTQARWGDICSDGPGGACTGVADGNPEVIQDVLGLIDKFQNINALQKSRADLVPGDDGTNNGPDFKVTIIGDALFALDAFQGFAYPFTPGDPCGPG